MLRLVAYRRRLPIASSVDAAIVVGSPREAREVERLASLGNRVYSVPGRRDDHYIARLLSAYSTSVEGHLVYHGSGLYVAGIGGREPLTNIKSLSAEIEEQKPSMLLLVSEYPPHGLFDRSRIGVSRGLFEVSDAVAAWRPRVVVLGDCYGPGVARVNDVLYVCLGSPECRAYINLVDGEFRAEVSCNRL